MSDESMCLDGSRHYDGDMSPDGSRHYDGAMAPDGSRHYDGDMSLDGSKWIEEKYHTRLYSIITEEDIKHAIQEQ